jgi:uncharacterized small protein (TIGR04563 family)
LKLLLVPELREEDLPVVDKLKQSLYFPEGMLHEIRDEAARLDRSLSWMVQRAWKVARKEIQAMPSDPAVEEEEED